MGQPFFRFRQFVIWQEHAAMRVSTDSVLLGAWASHPAPARILDIGTGTGVLALMMAQRYPEAHIDAVELDPGSCKDALRNFTISPWKERIRLVHDDFRKWNIRTGERYDLILSNPPYFQDSLHPAGSSRRIARHQTDLNIGQLLSGAGRLLQSGGMFSMILPWKQGIESNIADAANGLHTIRQWTVRTKPDKPVTRLLATFSRHSGPYERGELTLLDQSGKAYSDTHRELTSAFYLAGQT
jgi:tRNA1Val (adenine37-N6)-methyltransferase